jgi:hypothetical protein
VPVNSPYRIERANPSSARTSKWLRVRRGASERWVPLCLCSSGPPSEAELDKLSRQCMADRTPFPSRAEAAEVRARLDKARK